MNSGKSIEVRSTEIFVESTNPGKSNEVRSTEIFVAKHEPRKINRGAEQRNICSKAQTRENQLRCVALKYL